MTTVPERKRLRHIDAGKVVFRAAILAISSAICFWVMTNLLGSVYSISRDDDLLGGMWAVIATIFVYRESIEESTGAALSRMSATLVSFILCFIYLLFFPFHVLGMAGLIVIGAIALAMMGRADDIITASITTVVVMVAAAIGLDHAWREAILRLVDTAVGAFIGLGAAWISALGRSSVALPVSPAEE